MCDIECIFEGMGGKGSIYISNLTAAQNLGLLHSKGIQAILTAARSALLTHPRHAIPHYLYLPADDHADFAIDQYFPQTYEFIEQARKHTNVLVHCVAGVSRSVTIAVAYLIKKFKYSLQDVLAMMHRKRSKINPNRGFLEQLNKYAQQQGIKVSTKLTRSTEKDKNAETTQIFILKSKMLEKDAEYILTNPLFKYQNEKKDKIKPQEKTISTKADITDYSKKSEELKLENPIQSIMMNVGESLELCQSIDTQKIEQLSPAPLRKRFSIDSRHEHLDKKLTLQQTLKIEEKINRVREKMLLQQQKEGMRMVQTLTTKEEEGKKENSLQHLKMMLEKKKAAKAPSQYLSFGNKIDTSLTDRPQSNSHIPEPFNLYPCSTEANSKVAQDRSHC